MSSIQAARTYDPNNKIRRGPGPSFRRRQKVRRTDKQTISYLERWNEALVKHAYAMDKYVNHHDNEIFTRCVHLYEDRMLTLEDNINIIEELLEATEE